MVAKTGRREKRGGRGFKTGKERTNYRAKNRNKKTRTTSSEAHCPKSIIERKEFQGGCFKRPESYWTGT